MGLLLDISKFRPTFDAPLDPERAPKPIRLSTGPTGPGLICFPSPLAMFGPHQYVRFAKAFQGIHDVSALALPGYASGESLPASAEIALQALQDAVLQRAAGAPFALVGYSSGVIFAHALADKLERSGASPAAVILLDAYWSQSRTLFEIQSGLMAGVLAREQQFMAMDDVRLMAIGAYLRLFGDWKPAEIAAPTLLVRATEMMPGTPADSEWQATWDTAHVAVDVPGNHFTVMEDCADSTARAVQHWLSTIAPQA